jgi:DeoR/GlpR family transcriptional regulator of sugar metabolism
VLEITDKIYLIIDSHKINEVFTLKVCDISVVDFIITDKELDPEFLNTLKKLEKKIDIL